MDYYGPMLGSLRFKATALACLIVALLSASALADEPTPIPETPAAPLPSALDADAFYHLLLGEMLTAHGDFNTGYALLLDVARRTKDEQLFRRAADIAIQSRVDKYPLLAISAWLQALPQSRDANLYMLRTLVMLNRIQDTIGPIQLELGNASTEQRIATLHALPQLFAHASNPTEAAQVVERAVTPHLADPDIGAIAWITVGRLRLAAKDLPSALAALRNAHTLDAANESVAQLGLELLDAEVAAAEPLLEKYLNNEAAHPQLRIAYARWLVQNDRLDEARAQVQRVTEKHPDALDAWLMLSALHLEHMQLDASEKALAQFNEKLQALPDSEQPLEAVVQMYLMHAQIARQRNNFVLAEHWLDLIPNSTQVLEAQRLRITLLVQQEEQDKARALIRTVAADWGGDELHDRLRIEAQLLREESLFEAAYEVLARAAKLPSLDGFDRDNTLYEQAMMAEKLGRVDEMERLLKDIIARKPPNVHYAHSLNALGFSLADRNLRLPEAKALITRALELAPGDPFITDSLGWVEFRLGNHQEALRLLETAFEKRPHAEIAAHLGEMYWLLGQRERALSIWRKGLRLDKEDSALQDTLQRFGAEP